MEAFYSFKSGFNEVSVHFLASKSLQVDFFVLQDFSIGLTVPAQNGIGAHPQNHRSWLNEAKYLRLILLYSTTNAPLWQDHTLGAIIVSRIA